VEPKAADLGEQQQRFQCKSCSGNGCCEVYEHCVSCCLHPDKVRIVATVESNFDLLYVTIQLPLLHSILYQNTKVFHPLYSSLKDQFELCLSKCRTSSQVWFYPLHHMADCIESPLLQSVQHENAYRNPLTKFCYGLDTPTVYSEVCPATVIISINFLLQLGMMVLWYGQLPMNDGSRRPRSLHRR